MSIRAGSSSTDPFEAQLLSGRFQVQRAADSTPEVIAYQGIDTTTGKSVRIQRLVAFRAEGDVRSRLRTAGELIAQACAVSGVVAPIASGVHAGVPYLVLPAVSGGTLADRLRQLNGGISGPASVRSLRVWLQPIAETLDSLHQRGVVHGRLTPQAIGIGAGNRPLIDGVPIRQMVTAIGSDVGLVSDAMMQPYVAPEVTAGERPGAAADQYSLAVIAAECLGGSSFTAIAERRVNMAMQAVDLPQAVSKALAQRPGERFSGCAAFADELIRELESARQPQVSRVQANSSEAPLELELPGSTSGSVGVSPRATPPVDVPLELEEIETEAVRRSARRSKEPFDESLDITFTKAGESLLTPKSGYDRARSLAGTRSAWRRMREGYRDLSGSKQWIAKAVVGLLGLMLALWLIEAGWRAVRSIAGAAQTAARSVVETVKPDVASLQESGQQFAKQMRDLWNDIRPTEDADDHESESVAPSQGREERQVAGSAWPDRAQDRLTPEDIRDPSPLIAEIMGYKGIQVTADGLGAFHVDDPDNPERPTWIGGFGVLAMRGQPPKTLLHGTVVHHLGNGATCVARYIRGSIGEFWRITDREGRPVVAYTRLKGRGNANAPKPDGAAYVLDGFRTSCVAFVMKNGELVGGQWCKKAKDEQGKDIYLQPTEIASVSALDAADEAFKEAHGALEAMLGELSDFPKQAIAALKSYRQARTNPPAGGEPK